MTYLGQQFPHETVPLSRLLVHEPVGPVINPLEGEIELWKEMGSEKVLSCDSRLTQYLSYLGHKINRKSLKSIIPREPLLRLSDHAVRLGLKVKVSNKVTSISLHPTIIVVITRVLFCRLSTISV